MIVYLSRFFMKKELHYSVKRCKIFEENFFIAWNTIREVLLYTCIYRNVSKLKIPFVQLIFSKWKDVLHFCMLVTCTTFHNWRWVHLILHLMVHFFIKYRTTTPIHGAECNSCICLMLIQCFASTVDWAYIH